MQNTNVVRMVAVLLIIAAMFAGVSVVLAADGDSPANAIALDASSSETCLSLTIAPGATLWIKIPYHQGKDLEIVAKGYGGIQGDIFDPNQVASFPNLGKPVGQLTPNKNIPGSIGSWLGHFGTGNLSGFFYVRLTNTNAFPVTFSLCTQEREQFFPPPPPWPTPILELVPV